MAGEVRPLRVTVRSAALAVAALVAVAGAALAWRACRAGPTDEERIRAILVDAARAAEERRVSDVVAAVSERFRGPQGLDRAGLKQLVAYHALAGSWNAVVPVTIQVEVKGAEARGVAEVLLARGAGGPGVAGRLPGEGSAWRIEAALERERDGWKVVSARWERIVLDGGR